jgi:hypothetical protein
MATKEINIGRLAMEILFFFKTLKPSDAQVEALLVFILPLLQAQATSPIRSLLYGDLFNEAPPGFVDQYFDLLSPVQNHAEDDIVPISDILDHLDSMQVIVPTLTGRRLLKIVRDSLKKGALPVYPSPSLSEKEEKEEATRKRAAPPPDDDDGNTRAAKRARAGFKEGDAVLFRRDGECTKGVVDKLLANGDVLIKYGATYEGEAQPREFEYYYETIVLPVGDVRMA